MQNWRKILFFVLGLIFLILSYVGIILPGIPAIPFILLAGWFFLNSSTTLYNWMLSKRIIGKVLTKFFSNTGVSKKMKWFVISQFWISIIVAQFVFNLSIYPIILINFTGIAGSVLIYRLIK